MRSVVQLHPVRLISKQEGMMQIKIPVIHKVEAYVDIHEVFNHLHAEVFKHARWKASARVTREGVSPNELKDGMWISKCYRGDIETPLGPATPEEMTLFNAFDVIRKHLEDNFKC